MPRTRHVSRRTCLGCGASENRQRLLRLTLGKQGELKIDPWGPGRGGYLHNDPQCWQAFLKRKSTHRAFRAEIGRAAREKLIQALRERDGGVKRDG